FIFNSSFYRLRVESKAVVELCVVCLYKFVGGCKDANEFSLVRKQCNFKFIKLRNAVAIVIVPCEFATTGRNFNVGEIATLLLPCSKFIQSIACNKTFPLIYCIFNP